jgi:hypothetical protein
MKRFEVHRNIRKSATIMGLSLNLFAIMMMAVIGSLLVIIFSFSFSVVLSTIAFNVLLFFALSYFNNNTELFHLKNIFPKTISNKRQSCLYYEDH